MIEMSVDLMNYLIDKLIVKLYFLMKQLWKTIPGQSSTFWWMLLSFRFLNVHRWSPYPLQSCQPPIPLLLQFSNLPLMFLSSEGISCWLGTSPTWSTSRSQGRTCHWNWRSTSLCPYPPIGSTEVGNCKNRVS